MTPLLWLACIAGCSVGFRIRGGVLAQTRVNIGGGQMARLVFAIAAGLTAWTGVPWWLALATVPAWWLSATFPLFDGIDLGQNDGTFWGDVGALAARGVLWTALPAVVLAWPHVTVDTVMVWSQGAPHWFALFVVGPTMPLCYWLGRQSGVKAWGVGAVDWCQTGEAIYGAVLGIGILLAVS